MTPLLEFVFFVVGESASRIGRRHDLIGIGRMDAGEEFAFFWVEDGSCFFFEIEAEVGFAGVGIGAVAGEAVV